MNATMTDTTLNELLMAKFRQALEAGRQTLDAGPLARPTGKVLITARERKLLPKELIRLAERACPAWSQPDFTAKRWFEKAEEACYKLREANSETSLAFLMRKGVQTLANDWYIVSPREWQEYCGTNASDAFAEWYAPLYPSTVPGRIPRGERFPEGKVYGEDSVLVNQKFGVVESFDRELFDDDRTGQIRDRAKWLGQGMGVTENAYAAIRFNGASGSYVNLTVSASNYTTLDINQNVVTGPFSATLHGSYGNRPTSFGALGLNLLKQAWSELLVAKDPQGNKLVISPDVLIVSAKDDLHAKLLVAPPGGVPYYPAIVGQAGSVLGSAGAAGQGTPPTAGFPGGVFGANPFMGLGIKVVSTRYFPDWAWSLGQKGRGFIFQERDALEVIQEASNSGQAFEMDAYRFRSRRRFEADWVGGGSRFFWQGNDGSTSGSF